MSKSRCKTIWISDTHLGSKDCQVDKLKHFLTSVDADKIYLLGDIVDFWALGKKLWWPDSHYEILKILFQKAQDEVEVVYIPGNHDMPIKEYDTSHFGPIKIMSEAIHETVDGKKYLLFHGDVLDEQIRLAKWLKVVGDIGYQWLMRLNRIVSFWRHITGQDYWSLASYLKSKMKNAREAIDIYANAAVKEAKRRGLDGVICGHIHLPEIRDIEGIKYCNDGDWVEHCTALIENEQGELSLIRWTQTQDLPLTPSAIAA